jgi:IS605 OrfB family transposase
MFDQFRWYYNLTVSIFYNHYKDKILKRDKYSNYEIRDLVRKYEYKEELDGDFLIQDLVYNEDQNQVPLPSWCKTVHSRIPRGASDKFTSSLNSAITNYKQGNINKFKMEFRTKKNPTDYLHFEDSSYPAFINNIKSHYWFTDKNNKRTKISLKDITNQKRGLEIIHEKDTNKYFIHYPVDIDWYPEDDRRNNKQVKLTSDGGERIISLDPGVRKFLVGYDPSGSSIFIGEGASLEISNLLYAIDQTTDKKTLFHLWKQVKNLVNELHWKTISFLIENYDVIILPDFRVSQMIRSKKLARITKRLMSMFSFYQFREKLTYKCKTYNKKLIIVDESYTSCTCGSCGNITHMKGKELFICAYCKLKIDRDASGGRNIFIKNVTLRCG